MTFTIETAGVEDAEELLPLQKLAYREPAERYDDFGMPPMTQTLEQMRADLASHLYLKAVKGGRIRGAVRGRCEDAVCFVGRLVVHPDEQGRGLGQRLLAEIEGRFPQAERFELFTGHRDGKNLHVYEKAGYRECRREPQHDRLTLVYLDKKGGAP